MIAHSSGVVKFAVIMIHLQLPDPSHTCAHRLHCQEHGPFVYLKAIGTRPGERGKGLGTALLRKICSNADEEDKCKL